MRSQTYLSPDSSADLSTDPIPQPTLLNSRYGGPRTAPIQLLSSDLCQSPFKPLSSHPSKLLRPSQSQLSLHSAYLSSSHSQSKFASRQLTSLRIPSSSHPSLAAPRSGSRTSSARNSPHTSPYDHPDHHPSPHPLSYHSRFHRSERDLSKRPSMDQRRPRPPPTTDGLISHLPSRRPYSTYSLASRPATMAFGDEFRIVTGIPEFALPASRRPPPMPLRPAQSMSIDELQQRHRRALKRLQDPANLRIAHEDPPPLPTTNLRSSRSTTWTKKMVSVEPHRNQKPHQVPLISLTDLGSIHHEKASHDRPRSVIVLNDPKEEDKVVKKPKRWAFLKRFRLRAHLSPHSPPPSPSLSSQAPKPSHLPVSVNPLTMRKDSRAHLRGRVPLLRSSSDRLGSLATQSNSEDGEDSDSDVPLAQLRPFRELRAASSMGTVRTTSTYLHSRSITPNSRTLTPTQPPLPGSARPRPRDHHPGSSAHRRSLYDPSLHRRSQVFFLPQDPITPKTRSLPRPAPHQHRSSAWLDY